MTRLKYLHLLFLFACAGNMAVAPNVAVAQADKTRSTLERLTKRVAQASDTDPLTFELSLKLAREAARRNAVEALKLALQWTGPVPHAVQAEWNGYHRQLKPDRRGRIKFGLAVPVSGAFKSLGEAVLKGTRKALSRRAIPLLIQDTKGTEAGARQAIQRLARQNVSVIIGPIGHRESEAAAIEAARHKVALVSLTTKRHLERIHSNIFRYRCDRNQKADRLAVYAVRGLRQRRAAILYPDSPQSRGPMAAFWSKFERLGGQITGVESYIAGDSRSLSRAISALVGRRYTQYRTQSKKWARLNYKARDTGQKVKPIVDFEVLLIAAPAKDLKLIIPFLSYWDIPFRGGPLSAAQRGPAVQLLALDFRPAVVETGKRDLDLTQLHVAECVSGVRGLHRGFPLLAEHAFDLSNKLARTFTGPAASPEVRLRKSGHFRWSAYGLQIMQPSLYFVNQYGRLEELGQ